MKALVFDKSKYSWEGSKGFEKVDVPEPVLDEKTNPADGDFVIIKVHYAGVCGTDRGIWNRQAFKDAILNSIDAEMHTTPPPFAKATGGTPPKLAGEAPQRSPPVAGGGRAVGGAGRRCY